MCFIYKPGYAYSPCVSYLPISKLNYKIPLIIFLLSHAKILQNDIFLHALTLVTTVVLVLENDPLHAVRGRGLKHCVEKNHH